MSEGEVVKTSATGAKKAGNDERYSLLPADSFRLLARHFGRGALKYDDHNWRKGMPWSNLFDALNRHLWQFWNGEDIDPETGTPHIIAVMWHAGCIAEYMQTHRELDDRPERVEPFRVDWDEEEQRFRTRELQPPVAEEMAYLGAALNPIPGWTDLPPETVRDTEEPLFQHLPSQVPQV